MERGERAEIKPVTAGFGGGEGVIIMLMLEKKMGRYIGKAEVDGSPERKSSSFVVG